MTSTSAPTWWEDRQASLRDSMREDKSFADALLSDDLLTLLTEVEDAFARTGADTPAWEDPHLASDGTRGDPLEEEYSRCREPGKHRILWARAEAWTRVLAQRGWADAEDIAGVPTNVWVAAPPIARHRTTLLRPRRTGAQPLLLARTAPDDSAGSTDLTGVDALIPGLVVGVGDPVVAIETLPDCGCDACDSGSRDLLEQLDTAILSVVDGSFEVTASSDEYSQRTSFGASSGGGGGADDPIASVQIAAGPWADDWTPRPLVPAIDPGDIACADAMLRGPWPFRVVDTVLGALPWPLVRALRRTRPAGRRYVASASCIPLEESPVTVPRDALENVPAGYRRFHRSTIVAGRSFDAMVSDLLDGTVHERAGLRVDASRIPFAEGTDVRLRLGRGPLAITAPCRVVRVIDEPDRAGFAYATLPGHPESGIEEFTLTRTATGLVRMHIDAVSRPATWYARLGAPISRLVQEVITRRYLRALSDPS